MSVVFLSGQCGRAAGRGEIVVRIAAPAHAEPFVRCLRSVLKHTSPGSARLLIVAAPETLELDDVARAVRAALADTGAMHEVLLAADPAVDLGPAELVLLSGDRVVSAGWLEVLAAIADGDLRVATVSRADDRRGSSAELSAPSSGCVWITRAALDLVGELDLAAPLEDALADFGTRCLARGLRHVRTAAVDDVVEMSGQSAGPDRSGRPSVTIDGRCLGASVAGTAVAVLELAAGLRAHGGVAVRVLVLDGLGAEVRQLIESFGALAVTVAEAERAGPTDIAHRPYQLGVADDLDVLSRVGRRIVITHLDSIAYRTAAYFTEEAQWCAYRELTQAALAAADGIVFLSEDAAADARSLGLVGEERAAVIPLGIDGPIATMAADERPPDGIRPVPARPYLLCLGTDFAHKNRPFALRLLLALLDEGTFDGELVFAGPHVDVGSSAAEEAAEIDADHRLADRVVDVHTVTEGEKRWLIRHAAAVVYPTTFEGFGLIPFEAARAGVPALFTSTSSLRDLLGPKLALLIAWDPAASARRVAPVLVPGVAREELVHGIARVGARLTTADNARGHLELYREVLSHPERTAAYVVRRALEGEAGAHVLREQLGHARGRLAAIEHDPLARGFLGEDPVVSVDLQRVILAVVARPPLRRCVELVYRALRAGGRLARRGRRVSP